MELDSFLHRVQGVLMFEQRYLGNLSAIKKENEEDILKVITLLKKNPCNEELTAVMEQKLFILLFLNTETNMYNDLKKNKNYSHLVGFLPKLSQDLFLKIVMGLNIHQCLYDSVIHFCSSLSYQILDISLNALSWIDPFDAINFIENLLCCLFHKIAIVDETDDYNTHLKDIFQRILLYYDAEKGGSIKRMTKWKGSKLKHYAGLVMASLLSLVENCTKIYFKKEDNSSTKDFNLYNLEIDHEPVKAVCLEGTERLITLQQCYEYVVAKCLENVYSITVDLWLFWVEIDLDDIPDTENTLQRHVGEKAYTCRKTLKEAEGSSKDVSDLIMKLKNIALKPQVEDLNTSSLDLAQMLANIQDPSKNTKQWLHFLLNNSAFATEPAALKVLKNCFHLFDINSILKLSKLLFNVIKSNENCEHQKGFVFELMKYLDSDSQAELSKLFLESFGLTEVLKTDDFQPLFVEIFNKVINEEDKEKELYPQFMSLALQNPECVINRAAAEGITSEVRGHLMADILGRLQVFCDASVSDGNPLLVNSLDKLLLVLPDLPENQQVNYPLFVRELVMRKILNGERFIEGCLMTKLYQHLRTKNFVVVIACLEALSELFDIDCVYNCSASMVMLLQVVQANRWSPTTFTMAAVKACELALQLLEQFVTKWFDIGYEEKHQRNIIALVQQQISPINQYHMHRILEGEAAPSDPAALLLYRMHYGIGDWSVLQVPPDDRIKLTFSLCFVLPLLTSNEWQELFCVVAPKCSEFLALFHITTDSLLLCLDSAKANTDPAVISCLHFAVLNVAQVVKYELNRWTKNDNEYRISVLGKMCQLVSILPANQQESFGLTLIKVLQQLLPEGSPWKPLTPEEMNSVTASIATIHATNVRQNLAKEFLDMVHR